MQHKESIDGTAIVYCQGMFNTPEGKTSHGLVRFTERYNVVGIIDERYAGKDAGEAEPGIFYCDRRPGRQHRTGDFAPPGGVVRVWPGIGL